MRPCHPSPHLSAPHLFLRQVVNKAALAPKWRAGARRPGLGSRSPTGTCTRTRTRTAGVRTRPAGSQESPGRCARGVCPGSLETPSHWGL